jgi:hypothetical protein
MTVSIDVLSEDNYYQKAAVELSAGTGGYDALMVGNMQAGQYGRRLVGAAGRSDRQFRDHRQELV